MAVSKEMKDRLISAVLTAVILAVLALLARGVLVDALGGVTKAEFREHLHTGGGSPSLNGAVVAFDSSEGCPSGWSEVEGMGGHIIIGVSDEYKYRVPGGSETAKLELKNMPDHDHSYDDIYFPHRAKAPRGAKSVEVPNKRGATGPTDGNNSGWAIPNRQTAKTVGGGQSFSIMPPYIPLYLCTPDRGGTESKP